MPFGDVLRTLRKRHFLTQSQLGKAIGLSESTIGMYERGHREPDFETLEVIADYFNVDMDYLTGRSRIERKQSFSLSPLSPDELALIDNYRLLNNAGKEYIQQTVSIATQAYSEKNNAVPELETAN
jgi:repressor LexA